MLDDIGGTTLQKLFSLLKRRQVWDLLHFDSEICVYLDFERNT